jgi:hypothetical protein
VSIFRYSSGYRSGRVRDVWGFVTCVALAAVLVAAVVVTVIAVSVPLGRTRCKHWAEQTGIPTKYARLTFFDTGTCLAQASDGRWVKNTQVQIFISGTRKP